MGGHTLGHMDPNNSGYGIDIPGHVTSKTASWDGSPHVFDNKYFTALAFTVSYICYPDAG